MFEPRQLELFKTPSIAPVAGAKTTTSLHAVAKKGLRFSTIYADPPWRYHNTNSRGAAINHYQTMSLEEICSEPVSQIASVNSHLHLWTTSSFLFEAKKVIEAWGFTYKSSLVWVKDQIGLGNYWRLSHEILVTAVRGKLPFQDKSVRSWIKAPRTVHSRKPAEVRNLIERVSPGPYLEMYARERPPNEKWTMYGNQLPAKC